MKKLFFLLFAAIFLTGCITQKADKTLSSPSPSSESQAENQAEESAGTDELATYTSALSHYSVKYPKQLTISSEGYNEQLNETNYSAMFTSPDVEYGLPKFWITVTPEALKQDHTNAYNALSPDVIEALFAAKVGDKVASKPNPNNSPDVDAFWTYQKKPALTINGTEAVVIENPSVWDALGTTEKRVLFKANQQLYTIGCYYKTPAELEECDAFITSFRW